MIQSVLFSLNSNCRAAFFVGALVYFGEVFFGLLGDGDGDGWHVDVIRGKYLNASVLIWELAAVISDPTLHSIVESLSFAG